MNNSHNTYNTRGVVMVEFAIILPLLVMLLFGVTEIGRAIYQQNTLHRAIAVGARYLSHKEDIVALNNTTCSADETTETTPYSIAKKAAINLIVCGEEDCTNKTPVLPNLVADKVTVTVLEDAKLYDETNGLYACIIRVTATAPFSALFSNLVPFTDLTPPELNAQTEVRYIGY